MNNVLYDNIKKRRQDLNMSQQELAEAVGYSGKSMISQVEKGLIDISSSTITKFANALNCSESYLMGWVDNPDPDYPNTKIGIIESARKMIAEENEIEKQKEEQVKKAMALYEKYKNAPADIQSAVETLLKSVQQVP